jgi:DNA-binding IclR family transcriptional regulator
MMQKSAPVNESPFDGADAPASYMTDESSPTRRVLDVINFMAVHPGEEFSLAEVARQLNLSRGSAHRLLTTMADSDFLARNEKKKTYSLGMSLIAVGQAALEKYRGLDLARREMARLTLELNVQCSATTVVGGELLILAKEGLPQSHSGLNRVGERRPMVPPMGICHIAWGTGEAVEKYLAMAAAYMSADGFAWLQKSLKLIRYRGYATGANGPHWRELRQATVLPIGRSRDAPYWAAIVQLMQHLSAQEIQLASFDEVDSHGVAQVTVPVFSPQGSVALQLVLSGFPPNTTAKKMERCAERLCATATLLTSELNGRAPKISEL